jgi:hypothetical protein
MKFVRILAESRQGEFVQWLPLIVKSGARLPIGRRQGCAKKRTMPDI